VHISYSSTMTRTITQRELRNDSAAVLRDVEAWQTLVVTRTGTAVAELRPIQLHRTSVVIDHDVIDAARAAGRASQSRLADLLIASTAAVHRLPFYMRNPSDFDALRGIVTIVPV